MTAMTGNNRRWPSLPVVEWQGTRDTLHLYTQVVGKVRMTNEVTTNHWCNVPLHVTARGLTTSLVPHPTGPSFEIDFDFVAHRLEIVTVDGESRVLPLRPRPVAEFYAEVMALLAELGVPTTIWPVPVEIEGAIPFPGRSGALRRTTPSRCGASGWRSSRSHACSWRSAAVSSARRARCTCSGERWISPRPVSRAGPHRRTRAVRRTAGPT